MKKILKSFKDLFLCDNSKNRHLMWVSLMILPCIAGGIMTYIDKETPQNMMITLGILALIFFVLSIVPFIYLLGFGLEFYEMRLNNETGIPKVNNNLFNKGLKGLPIYIVWCLYSLLAAVLFIFLPIFLAIVSAISLGNNYAGIIGITIVTILLVLTFWIALLLISPFIHFICIDFVKTYEYKSQYFNPIILIEYIKKSFKDTILVFLKMTITSIVVNSAYSLIWVLLSLGTVAVTLIIVALTLEKAGVDPMYTLPARLLIIPFSIFGILLQSYITNLVYCVSCDMYVEVYKNKIETV